ncbi:hypothetical protein [Ottowia sp. VDI28]|uniref:hypothetical protein n=1 Tax=Ottowia sp. VDI28 TaxID=3133968 RepID=UPI003C303CB5
MNIPLQRMIDGIIATMRSDVIPHVTDSYARGQAIGVIDILNNLAPRVEWAQMPLARQVDAKRALLAEIAVVLPALAPAARKDLPPPHAADDLLSLKAELDASIGDAIALVWPRRHEAGFDRLAALIREHLHEELSAEMKITRKPLFAEIARGGAEAGT